MKSLLFAIATLVFACSTFPLSPSVAMGFHLTSPAWPIIPTHGRGVCSIDGVIIIVANDMSDALDVQQIVVSIIDGGGRTLVSRSRRDSLPRVPPNGQQSVLIGGDPLSWQSGATAAKFTVTANAREAELVVPIRE